MASYPGGWITLEASMPQSVDMISLAKVGVTNGNVINSTVFNTATGGTWNASPIALNGEPTVLAINASQFPDMAVKGYALNMHTKTYNDSAPLPLKNLIFCFGNEDGKTDFQMDFPLNLGGSNYDLFQLSILENAATQAYSTNGNIPVIDFGSGPFTGLQTLSLVIAGFYGTLNLGIRLEKTDDTSSLFDLRLVVLQVV